MAQHLEIERKFLVKALPRGWKGRSHSKIAQGYLPCGGTGVSVRLRTKDAKHVLTVKAGRGRRRVEEEIDIKSKSFEALWPLTKGARVTKTRYQIPLSKQTIDLDIYHGKLRGLTIAEVEFDSERASHDFKPPSWFDREVTADQNYANECLARGRRRPR